MLVHAFGCHEVAVEILPNELVDEHPCNFVVKALLFQIIYVQVLRVNLNKKLQSLFVDVAVEKGLHHILEKVEPLQIVFLRATPLFHQLFDNSFRFSLLLNEGNYQPNHVGDDVSVLNLLHAALPLGVATFRIVFLVFIYNNVLHSLLGLFLHLLGSLELDSLKGGLEADCLTKVTLWGSRNGFWCKNFVKRIDCRRQLLAREVGHIVVSGDGKEVLSNNLCTIVRNEGK